MALKYYIRVYLICYDSGHIMALSMQRTAGYALFACHECYTQAGSVCFLQQSDSILRTNYVLVSTSCMLMTFTIN